MFSAYQITKSPSMPLISTKPETFPRLVKLKCINVYYIFASANVHLKFISLVTIRILKNLKTST